MILLYVIGKYIIGGYKLSNSGDALKLMVPSQNRKVLSGWSNYPCMVTSHKIDEKKIGYRGSKSKLNFVKEQRVDGSWYTKLCSIKSISNKLDNFVYLRCTLMGFERNYQIKILSKQLKIQRTFCYSELDTHISSNSFNNS
jgi:hypothetical protein